MFKEILLLAAATLAAAALVTGVGVLAQGSDFVVYQWLAPKREAVRREVFEQTKSYRQGTAQELRAMQFEYLRSSPEHRDALRSVILHRVADSDQDGLPDDLRRFVDELKTEDTK